MKTLMFVTAVGLLAVTGGCQSTAESNAYANPLDACASIEDAEDRDRCVKNVVADVAMSTKREAERKRVP